MPDDRITVSREWLERLETLAAMAQRAQGETRDSLMSQLVVYVESAKHLLGGDKGE